MRIQPGVQQKHEHDEKRQYPVTEHPADKQVKAEPAGQERQMYR